MLPNLIFVPGGTAELMALVVAVLLGAAAARSARARTGDERLTAMFAAYLAGFLSLTFAVHATVLDRPLAISSYALALVTGVLVTWALLLPRLRAMGLSLRLLYRVFFGGFVAAIATARVAHMIGELPRVGFGIAWLRELPQIQHGGLGVFGGFVGLATVVVIAFRRAPPADLGAASLARALDASTSAMALGLAIGRSGCLLAGCCFGALTASRGPWTLPVHLFASDSPAGVAYADIADDRRVWATQPLEAVGVLLIATLSELLLRRARGLREGSVFAFAVAAYGVLRASLEVVRADSARIIADALTVWQLASITLVVGALAWMLSTDSPSRPRV